MSNTSDNQPSATTPLPEARSEVPPEVLLELAKRQFAARFEKDALDQRGRLFFLLLDHVVANLKEPRVRNGAAAGDVTRFEELAYEAWAADERGGQQDRPIQDLDLQKLFGYWRRGVAKWRQDNEPPNQTFRMAATRRRAAETRVTVVTISEQVDQPFHRGPTTARFILSLTSRDGDIGTVPFITAAAQIDGVPFLSNPNDERVLLPDRSIHRALNENSRALAAAFRSYPKHEFVWEQDPACQIRIKRRRPAFHRRTAAAAVVVLVALSVTGCELAVRRAAGLVRRDLYGITSGASVATVCPEGKPINLIGWNRPMPDWRVVHVELLRNAKPVKRVDGLKEFTDAAGIVLGGTYTYNFRVVDFLGRVIQEEDSKIGTFAMCPGAESIYKSPWTVSPTAGTWQTAFKFSIRPPSVDGEPRSYSWGWEGSKLDYNTNTLYHRVTTPQREPSITRRFTPCDDCVPSESDPDGTRVFNCRMTADVRFEDGSIIRYWGGYARVRDEPSMECRNTGPVVVAPRE